MVGERPRISRSLSRQTRKGAFCSRRRALGSSATCPGPSWIGRTGNQVASILTTTDPALRLWHLIHFLPRRRGGPLRFPSQYLHAHHHWRRRTAPMQGVISVRQCRVIKYGLAMVIGLEFQYTDGSVVTVGQVRRDRLGCAWAVSASDQLWLEFRLTEHKFPYVAGLRLSKPALETEAWFGVAWTGPLEWWFSTRQCQVWEGGRASLRTRY